MMLRGTYIFARLREAYYKRIRRADIEILWPSILERAGGEYERAMQAFLFHASLEPAWFGVTEKEIRSLLPDQPKCWLCGDKLPLANSEVCDFCADMIASSPIAEQPPTYDGETAYEISSADQPRSESETDGAED